jgi:FMN phosphatase YigB (HAD superfamily)
VISAVVLDVGETLVSEERVWTDWARWVGVPPTTFLAYLGAVIERRQHHLEVFRPFVGPDFDVERERLRLLAAGRGVDVDASDLYPDALPCLRGLRSLGLRVGVAGNQPPDVTEALVAASGVEVDLVASSTAWEVEKPSPAFFARLAAEMGVPASEIAYVGDRVDNDVLPAAAAGMVAVHLRRGPWGYVHAGWPEAAAAQVRLTSLAELTDELRNGGHIP